MATTPLLTYKSFMDDLIFTLESHQQVHTVATGMLSDLASPKTPNTIIVYPYIFLMNNSIQITANPGMSYFNVLLDVVIADQCKDNQEAIIDCQSNMLSILMDIIAGYSNVSGCAKPYRMILPQLITPKLFVNRGVDNICGLGVTLNFEIEQPMTRQFLPMSNV